jgi:hypothetical protein
LAADGISQVTGSDKTAIDEYESRANCHRGLDDFTNYIAVDDQFFSNYSGSKKSVPEHEELRTLYLNFR